MPSNFNLEEARAGCRTLATLLKARYSGSGVFAVARFASHRLMVDLAAE